MYDTLKRHPKYVHTKVEGCVYIYDDNHDKENIEDYKITLRRYLPKTASTCKNYKKNRKKDTYH